MGNRNIEKLKSLVEKLSDRDHKLKQEHRLFSETFEHIPCHMVIWQATDESNIAIVRSTIGASTSLANIVECPALSVHLSNNWDDLKAGQDIEFTCYSSGHLIWNRVSPQMVDDSVVGIVGVTWDLTASREFIDSVSLESESQVLDYSLGKSPKNNESIVV